MTSNLSRIPSSSVAVAGAAVVLVATAIGAIWYQQTTSERARVSAEASSLHARADGLWASHLQGDQRSATAGVFVALALSLRRLEDPSAVKFAFGRAAFHLHGAHSGARARR